MSWSPYRSEHLLSCGRIGEVNVGLLFRLEDLSLCLVELPRLLSAVTNPFLQDRVDSPWDAVRVDLEVINRTAFEACLESVRHVRETGRSRGLALHGEPGSGKTHLLQRLHRWVQQRVEEWFIYVPPATHPDRFFRHLLECIVKDLVRQGQRELSQIEITLGRQLMNQLGASVDEAVAWWQGIQVDNPPGPALFTFLQAPLEALAWRLQLDPEVITVLRHYLAGLHRFEAYTWLLGRAIREEDVSRLGAWGTLDDEERAKYNAP